jgi:hypothetical protein
MPAQGQRMALPHNPGKLVAGAAGYLSRNGPTPDTGKNAGATMQSAILFVHKKGE